MSRRVPEKDQHPPYWSTGCLVLAAGIAGSIAGSASAQTGPSTQRAAEPVVGQVSLNTSPLSTNAANNQPRFTLVPSVRAKYDTNAQRNIDLGGGPRDNTRVTPGIDLDYHRLFGRVAFDVSGSAGYDFNNRFRFLNQSRINFTGSARAPVGSTCSAKAEASYDKSSFDLNETQAVVGSSSTIQNYSVNANCSREAGINPIAGFTYQALDSSQARYLRYLRYVENFGVSYTQPSIGTVSLNLVASQLRRPYIAELTGFKDDTNLYTMTLTLNRSVSPRIHIIAGGGLTKAAPQRAGVRSFLGPSFNGRVEWLPTTRFSIAATAAREVTSQNGISATYVVREDYTLTAGLEVSAKSHIRITGSRTQRDFRGEDLTPSLQPIRADLSNTVSAGYDYDLSRRLRVGFALSHRWRTADNPFYDYTSTVLSSSIGAHF